MPIGSAFGAAAATARPRIRPPTFEGSAGTLQPFSLSGPALNIWGTSRAATQANRNELELSNPAYPSRAAANAAAWSQLRARQATLPLQAGVLGAQGAQNASQRSYYTLLGGILTQRRADASRLTAAENNLADKTNVALARQAQQGEDARYSMLRVPPPVDVDVRPGERVNEPGLRASIRPQAEYVGEEITQAERVRSADLNEAQNRTALAGADVAEARNRLGYGELGAEAAGYESDAADLRLRQEAHGLDYLSKLARYNYEESQVPPEPGLSMYTSKLTGESFWGTPVNVSKREALDQAALGSPSNLVQLIANGFISPDEAESALVSLGVPQGQVQQIVQQAQQAVQRRNAPQAPQAPTRSPGSTQKLTQADLITRMVMDPSLTGDPQFLAQLVQFFRSQGYDEQMAQYKAGQAVTTAQNRINKMAEEDDDDGGGGGGAPKISGPGYGQ